MSLPLNTVLATPVQAAFLPPADLPYAPLLSTVLGGTAIGDGEAGRQIQLWTASYGGDSIIVAPESGITAFTLPVDGVLTLALAFDTNMQVTLAYQTVSGSHLYYFDSFLAAYTTLDLDGTTSCQCAVDDARKFNNAASDVIFAYVHDTTLYYRQQRDRYATERTIGTLLSPGTLQRIGMSTANRLQFKIAKAP
jgi:hypothetical protein